jgi:hypothetical protein
VILFVFVDAIQDNAPGVEVSNVVNNATWPYASDNLTVATKR